MKTALFLSAIALLLMVLDGCSSVTYKGPCGEISRTGLGSDLSAGRVSIEVGEHCEKRIVVDGVSEMQSGAIKAAAEGAAEGAARGLKP